MGVFDDHHLKKWLDLSPLRDWQDPLGLTKTKLVIPEYTFAEVEAVPGGTMVTSKRVQRELDLDRGLTITELGRAPVTGETTFRVSGLVRDADSVFSGLTPELAKALEEQKEEYKRIMHEVTDPEIRAIREEYRRKIVEGGGGSVWEVDLELTEQEMALYGFARPGRKEVVLGTEFFPDASDLKSGVEALSQFVRSQPAPGETERQEVDDRLKHEALNVYGMQGIYAPYLSPTWWMFLKDLHSEMADEFQNIHDAQEALKESLYDRLHLEPGADLDSEETYLLGARYEVPDWGEDWIYKDARLQNNEGALAWADFLSGYPYGCCEMLVLAGEVTTETEKWPTSPDDSESPVPPVPDDFFQEEQYGQDKVAYNLNWLENDHVEAFIEGVKGEKNPSAPNWWLRINFVGSEKYPYPGEFFGLGVRIFPNLTWGHQKNSPFLYSGNWIDTKMITSAQAKIVEKTAEGYYICQIDWRKKQDILVYPSDFAEYRAGERVTIMKDLSADKTSQLWKDKDCFEFDAETWRIVPLTYYGKGFEKA